MNTTIEDGPKSKFDAVLEAIRRRGDSYRVCRFTEDEGTFIVRIYEGRVLVGSAQHLTQREYRAYKMALLLLERNAPGDKERAVNMLFDAGFDLFVTQC